MSERLTEEEMGKIALSMMKFAIEKCILCDIELGEQFDPEEICQELYEECEDDGTINELVQRSGASEEDIKTFAIQMLRGTYDETIAKQRKT